MDIGSILIKKINSTLSSEEEEFFKKWVNASLRNQHLYAAFLKRYENGEELPNVDDMDVDEAWEVVLNKSGNSIKSSHPKHYTRLLLKHAATVTVLFGLGYLYFGLNHTNDNIPPNIEDAITLKLDNGEVKVISPESMQTINNDKGEIVGVQKGVLLDYSKASKNEDEAEELVYNELTVPFGKRFGIVLSDGTKVHLNAGSVMRYPVKFPKAGNRQVSIVGEGYFKVHKDSLHPFIVSTGNMNLRVLGTTFNLSSYPEDQNINTVLVEGSVGLYGKDEEFGETNLALLEPGYKASWGRSNRNIHFEKVDPTIYTSWINGQLVLKKMSFENIREKLQRHYKVVIENHYAKLDHQVFTATFDKETIYEVLDSFKEDTPFDYTVEGNQITIKEPITNNMQMK